MTEKVNLTEGNVTAGLLRFAAPLIVGNILQQIYSITDTLIVGKWLGADALAAVGSTYTLTTFLYSIIIGMCMGSGGLISFYHGVNDREKTRRVVSGSFVLILGVTVVLELVSLLGIRGILTVMHTPVEIYDQAFRYTRIILVGMLFVFLYNEFAYVLRALGNSAAPMYALAVSTVLNVILDILFVVTFGFGVEGAAIATVIAQIIAGVGIMIYCMRKEPVSRIQLWGKSRQQEENVSVSSSNLELFREILHMSLGASVQQSVMNFGILMIQGLINSFGAATMAAFTVAVKIDTLAYMPAQEFANAFSLFVSKNFGAHKTDRIKKGIRTSFAISTLFCLAASGVVYCFAEVFMNLFLKDGSAEIGAIGVQYLRVEGVFYFGIGLLMLFYGYFRGLNRPGVSVVLTVISLGTRVVLAYTLSPIPQIGVMAIWTAIPIGWILADIAGACFMKKFRIEETS